MLTFKKYLEEAMTSPYESFYKGAERGKFGDNHRCEFYDNQNRPFSVTIYNHTGDKSKGKADVSFSDENDSIGNTGMSGKHSMRIFSTVKDIMKRHADTHKDITQYVFSSFKDERDVKKTKAKLYRAIAKAHGGDVTTDTDLWSNYMIPVKRE